MARGLKPTVVDKALLTRATTVFRDEMDGFAQSHLGMRARTTKLVGKPSSGTIEVRLTLFIHAVDGKGKVQTPEVTAWKQHAEAFGLKQEWLGAKVPCGGRLRQIVGLDMKRRVNRVVLDGGGLTTVLAVLFTLDPAEFRRRNEIVRAQRGVICPR